MNTLSWLIYAAQVVGGIQALLIIFGIQSALIVLFGAFFFFMGDEEDAARKIWRWVWVPVVLLSVATLVPSRTTIYMIAASEAGEAVVTSPDAIEMMGDLKAIIKKQLKQQLSD